jgi:tetratricopeptide (TPR) repeat protein
MRHFGPAMVNPALVLTILLLILPGMGCSDNSRFPDRLLIISLLENRDFDALDRLLNVLQDNAEKDIANEIYATFAFETFQEFEPDHESILNRWMAGNPQSYAARLAAGEYFYHLGTIKRGGSRADETSPEQFREMNAAFDRAIRHVKEAISLRPTLIEGYYLLAQIAMFRGEEHTERELVQQALKISPASFRIRRSYMQALLPRWGGSHEAMEVFAADSQIHGDRNPRLKSLRGLVAWDLGKIAVSQKDYGLAVRYFSKALEAGEYATFYADRADAHIKMKDYGKALADANAALALYPQSPSVLADRARAFSGLGRFEEAAADLEAAAKLNPAEKSLASIRDWLAGKLAADAYEAQKRGRYDESLALFGKALKIDPKRPETYYWRGRTYIQKGRLELARSELEEALQFNPHYFEALQSLDWVLAQTQRWDDILTHWNRFLRDEPDNANAYLERAGAFRRKGDMPAALDDLKTACRLGNGNACQFYEPAAVRP